MTSSAASGTLPGRPAVIVNLAAHRNNTGITASDGLSTGAFNIWGNTFPAEEVPPGGRVLVDDVPFEFPAAGLGMPDNVRCAAQLVRVPHGHYERIHVLAAAERRTEDLVLLIHTDGTASVVWLRVSDFWPQTPARFGERPAFVCSRLHYPHHVELKMGPVLWHQQVPIPVADDVCAIRLPDNPAIHIFALTLIPIPELAPLLSEEAMR